MRKAVTVIEAVVVVAIIAVIGIILVPIFQASRPVLPQNACMGSVKKLGTGMLMYLADNDSHFPTSAHPSPGAGWGQATYPYVKDPTAYRCPSDTTTAPKPETWPMGAAAAPPNVYSYGLNSNLAGADVVGEKGQMLRQPAKDHASLEDPERTAMFFEVSEAVGFIAPPAQASKVVIDTLHVESPTGNTTNNPILAMVPNKHPGQPFPDGLNPDPLQLHALYATGDVGGRHLNGSAGSKPRHGNVSVFVACDGSAKPLEPEAVSGGADAVDRDCDQGTEKGQTGPCAKQKPANAAGIGVGRFKLTFSSK